MFSNPDYWLDICNDDLKAAHDMLISKNYLWMGFICHLIAEKALKAAIAHSSCNVPPKIHDLPELADKTFVKNDISDKHRALLRKLTPLQIEARYPEYREKIRAVLSESYCKQLLKDTEDFLCWIKMKLGK